MFGDRKITAIARQLEPFVRKIIREMLGGDAGVSYGQQTWIHGTGFPQKDTLGTRGKDAVDLQLKRDALISAQVAGGDRSCVLGGEYNRIDAEANDSIVGGSGGWAYKNPCAFIMGNYVEDYGDAQSGRYTEKGEIILWFDWQDIAKVYMRNNVHTVFNALVLGVEANRANQYAYRVVGSVTNVEGVMQLNYSLVSPMFETEEMSASASVSPSLSPSTSDSPSTSVSPSVSSSESVSVSPSESVSVSPSLSTSISPSTSVSVSVSVSGSPSESVSVSPSVSSSESLSASPSTFPPFYMIRQEIPENATNYMSGGSTYIHPVPCTEFGFVDQIEVFSYDANPTGFQFAIFERDGNNFTDVAFKEDFVVNGAFSSLTTWVEVDDFALDQFPIEPGQYLGWYIPSGASIRRGSVAGGTGYLYDGGDQIGNGLPSAFTTTYENYEWDKQIRVRIRAIGSSPSETPSASVSPSASISPGAYPYTMGCPTEPADSASSTNSTYTYIYDQICPGDGIISKIEVFAYSDAKTELKFGVFTKDVDDFTDDHWRTLTVSDVGLNTFVEGVDFSGNSLPILAGEYFGWFGVQLDRQTYYDAYRANSGDQIGDGLASTFGASVANNRVQIRVTVRAEDPPIVFESASDSPSSSISISDSPSESVSVSPSPSRSGSQSLSPSGSPSPSASQSPSHSDSPSISVSESISVSPSLSISISPSGSVSPSVSPSISYSPSVSPSISPSESISNINIRVVVDDADNSFVLQASDSGNSGRPTRWMSFIDTAEVAYDTVS